MGLTDLITALEHAAETRIAELRNNAERQAQDRRAEARRAADGRLETALRNHGDTARQALASDLAQAERQLRVDELRARSEAVDRLFDAARRALAESSRRTAFAAHALTLLAEALPFLGERAAEVRCDEATAAALATEVARHPALSLVVDPEAPPGVSVRAVDGSVTLDNTLATRLLRLREGLGRDVAALVNTGADTGVHSSEGES